MLQHGEKFQPWQTLELVNFDWENTVLGCDFARTSEVYPCLHSSIPALLCFVTCPSISDSLQYFFGVAGVGALFVRCPEAAWLWHSVWPPVQYHGGGCRGNDSHCITYPGLDVVVPFVIWHRDKPWERQWEKEKGRESEVRRRHIFQWIIYSIAEIERNMEKNEKEGERQGSVRKRGRTQIGRQRQGAMKNSPGGERYTKMKAF